MTDRAPSNSGPARHRLASAPPADSAERVPAGETTSALIDTQTAEAAGGPMQLPNPEDTSHDLPDADDYPGPQELSPSVFHDPHHAAALVAWAVQLDQEPLSGPQSGQEDR